MHESVKSRSSTPQQEFLRLGLSEAFHLLQKWNLMELQNVFRDHDITLRSLLYLTDDEITELIPKIGLRTIFRAMLKDWRKAHYNDKNYHSRTSTPSFDDNESFLDQIELKTECNSEDFEATDSNNKDNSTSQNGQCIDYSSQNGLPQQDENNNETLNQSPQKLTLCTQRKSAKTQCGEKFIVLDILKRSSDGQTVLEFYNNNKFLDIKNRKRLVNLLIREVVERRVDKYTAIFHDMTHQILELFPNEKYDTYFVAHSGSQSARGALYYRYSNYTRQLRKEGILAYKKQKSRIYFK
ncbi:uncharacterized protein LOC142237935 [Haematobia irritans]|uniref:uncharacterized protein LOC142237935 n=1 Tax=Haematobia irritans TaxID=7368 RepID=UPI003F50B762